MERLPLDVGEEMETGMTAWSSRDVDVVAHDEAVSFPMDDILLVQLPQSKYSIKSLISALTSPRHRSSLQ